MEKKRKILAIGLCKTGTVSLCRALQSFGLTTLHGPYRHAFLPEEEKRGSLAAYDAIAEFWGLFDFQVLLQWFPYARCILTERDEESWHASCAHQFGSHRPIEAMRDPEEIRKGRLRRFGVLYYDESIFSGIYREHKRIVTEYCLAYGEKDLLRMRIIGGDGFPELCSFLGRDPVSAPFPHINRTLAL